MIDVSNYQPHIDWSKVHAYGVRRAYVKATQVLDNGTLYVNELLARQVDGAATFGIEVGVYAFANPAHSPRQDAAQFLRTVERVAPRALDTGALVPMLDLEVTKGHDWAFLNDWKAQWFAQVDAHIGRHAGFYSYYYYWKQMRLYPDRPVWGAAYGNAFTPPKEWWAWQYSSNGRVDGIPDPVDVSHVLKPLPRIGS